MNLKLAGYEYFVVITALPKGGGFGKLWHYEVKYASDTASTDYIHTAGKTARCSIGGWDDTHGGLADLSTTAPGFFSDTYRDMDCYVKC
jgi:hypothetical protein